ncbi:MAG: D-2-hydroxyacid dehydrogenase [Chloroflexi bacterium]|nr:D-2-hydroxyacid dehydrogenase [Chloroflexota bacterium]
MDKPNILITSPMGREYVAKLNTDPRVGRAQQLPREQWSLFRQVYESGPKAVATGPREMAPFFAEADIIICMGMPHGSVKWTPRLKWVQAWSAGVDHMQGSGIIEAGIPVTTLAGANAAPVAEHALMMMLMLAKNMKGFMENARSHTWRPTPEVDELGGRTVGIVGLGAIGRHVANLSRAFDMRVLAIRRSAASRQRDTQGVDELLPPADLPYLLKESDFILLSLPLSKETEKLIGEGELRSMKRTAHLINVARGEVVDEPALIQALKEGWIAGAGLDVFTTEPLEPESPLWDMPNVLMTSHRAGRTLRLEERQARMFEGNLDRFLAGQPLLYQVDPHNPY